MVIYVNIRKVRFTIGSVYFYMNIWSLDYLLSDILPAVSYWALAVQSLESRDRRSINVTKPPNRWNIRNT